VNVARNERISVRFETVIALVLPSLSQPLLSPSLPQKKPRLARFPQAITFPLLSLPTLHQPKNTPINIFPQRFIYLL
jgi:hypothetical protein